MKSSVPALVHAPLSAPIRLGRKIPPLAVCMACADFLLFRQPLGLSSALFLLMLTATIILENRGRISASRLKAALILPAMTVPALLENTSVLSVGFATLSVLTLALADRVVWFREPQRWLALSARFPGAGIRRLAEDSGHLTKALRHGCSQLAGTGSLVSWIVPVGLTLTFVALFAFANPVIALWIDWVSSIDAAPAVDFERLVFWLASILVLWPLLRRASGSAAEPNRNFRSARPQVPAGRPTLVASFQSLASPTAVVRSLVLFNGLFAIQMLLDAVYLVGGATLPDGMSYAQYAHRGAYPLVAAALLAAAFVVAAVRPGSAMERDPLVRRLVFAWIVQTLVLLATSLWRLDLYVSVYSLTYWRAAAAIWMILVGFGLGWILLRLLANKTNAWLMKANFLTLVAVLHACCFVDFGGRIASYNVEQASNTEGDGIGGQCLHRIDLHYLGRIGQASIPALDRLAANPAAPVKVRADAARISSALRARFESAYKGWRGFTLRRARLARYIRENAVPNTDGRFNAQERMRAP